MDEMIRDAGNLVVFATVVQSGSISDGAHRLGLERTTVSRRIRDFESRLGTKLLHRSNRRVTVTDAGRLCYLHSLRVIKAAEDASAAVRGGVQDEPIVIGAPIALIESLVNGVLLEMRNAFPSVRLDVRVIESGHALHAGTVDLAVLAGTQPALDERTVLRKLGRLERCIVASPGYATALQSATVPGDIRRLRWIGEQGPGNVITVYRDSPRGRETFIIPAVQVPDAVTAMQLAVAGRGLCVLPRLYCRPLLHRGELVAVLDHYAVPPLDLYLGYPRAREPGVVAEAFAGTLVQQLLA